MVHRGSPRKWKLLSQNAGKECSDEDTATFLNIKYNKGPYALELSSALMAAVEAIDRFKHRLPANQRAEIEQKRSELVEDISSL